MCVLHIKKSQRDDIVKELKYAIEDIPDIKDLTNHKTDIRVIENIEGVIETLKHLI